MEEKMIIMENQNKVIELFNSNRVNANVIIDKYIDTLNSELTKKSYRKSIYEFLNFLYGENMSLLVSHLIVNPSDAHDYMKQFKDMVNNEEIKKSTYNAKIKGVKSFYEWLKNVAIDNMSKKSLLVGNPFATVKLLVENDSEGSMPLTQDEILMMLSNPYGRDTHKQERNMLLFILGVTTGVRNTALIGIELNNIQIVDGIHIVKVKQKGDKLTKKPIRKDLYNRLMKWYQEDIAMRESDNGTIFNMTNKHSNDIISNWAKSVGIEKKITFHSLRTTTAVEVYNGTNNIYEAQEFLDHSNAGTTKIYVGKQKDINFVGTNIIEDIVNANHFLAEIQEFEKDDILAVLNNLPTQVKSTILNELKNRAR